MTACLYIRVNVAVAATASVRGIALRGTSRRGYYGVIAVYVIKCRDGFFPLCFTYRTSVLADSRRFFRWLNRHYAVVPFVTEGVGIAIHVAVATMACVGSVALRGTSRCSYYGFVVVTRRGKLGISRMIATRARFVRIPTDCGTRGCFRTVLCEVVTERIYFTHFKMIAISTISALCALGSARRRFSLRPSAVFVTACRHVTIHITVTAMTSVGSITLRDASRNYNGCFVIMLCHSALDHDYKTCIAKTNRNVAVEAITINSTRCYIKVIDRIIRRKYRQYCLSYLSFQGIGICRTGDFQFGL